MNRNIIIYMLGWIMNMEAIFMTLPVITAVVYRESIGFIYLGVAVVCGLLGFLCTRKKPCTKMFFAREGFVTVSLGWIVLSFFGCIPFVISGEIPHIIDAMFEIVSGFTTTGSSIIPKVEDMSHATLMWRSFSHWIGGMGILVFILAILPMAGDYNMHIMRAESPGPSVGKLVPKIKNTAMILYGIYLGITLIEITVLMFAGLNLYEAATLTFSTVGTGGFGLLNSSIGSYSMTVQTIFIIFMLLCGINFQVFYLLLIKKPKEAFGSEELRYYLGIVLAAALLIAFNVRGFFASGWEAFHHSMFQVVSVMTTTGFATLDYNVWPEFSRAIIFLLTLLGACAGSTGGGFKVSRLIVLLRSIKNEIFSVIHPRGIKKLHMDGRIVEDGVIKSIQVYTMIYVMILLGSFVLVSLNEFDFVTNITAVATTFNNVGPGFNMVGPAGNYSAFSVFSKLVLMFDMLAGRLELLPMIVLFSPRMWRK